MPNQVVKTIFKNVQLPLSKRLQVDELAAKATLPEMFQGYGLPLNELCLSEEQHEVFLIHHCDKLNPKGSSFFLTEREGELFVLHTCLWRSCCEVFEEELHSSSRIWLPQYGHRIIVPKIN